MRQTHNKTTDVLLLEYGFLDKTLEFSSHFPTKSLHCISPDLGRASKQKTARNMSSDTVKAGNIVGNLTQLRDY